ncbi:hypothetical protein QFC21_006555 [Naganishia friedmannii]|uniref:Uncharacterized protein n=1 Tax=Naganishia friedmannii TaxID=89922 RepID=A0ACC2V373_9TREE|nr:hypothetical protein QFC21_006555 [Naganishia friedmannii]
MSHFAHLGDGSTLNQAWEQALTIAVREFKHLVASSGSKSWKLVNNQQPHASASSAGGGGTGTTPSLGRGREQVGITPSPSPWLEIPVPSSISTTATPTTNGSTQTQQAQQGYPFPSVPSTTTTTAAADLVHTLSDFNTRPLPSDVILHRRTSKSGDTYRATLELPLSYFGGVNGANGEGGSGGGVCIDTFARAVSTPEAWMRWQKLVEDASTLDLLDVHTRVNSGGA